jgi:hypothetical protein
MFSQPKSAVHQQAPKLFQQQWRHLKGYYDLNSAFENTDRLLEKKRTGTASSAVSFTTVYCVTNILKPTCVGVSGTNIFNSITNQRSPQEILKPPATLI